ncbi:prepilin peptidase [Candidatus Woesearchaeota archaeon]|nr:prepilin peptidase [Candidatus Woesearchaeota archaeon]
MELIYFLIIIALFYVFIAMLFDIKTKEVPDWLSYSLIIISLGIEGIYSLFTKNYWIIIYGLIGASICFLFGCLMYYTKQWGGGDSKLLIGLGAIFSYDLKNILELKIPFLAILIVNIIICGGIYTIIYGLYLIIKNFKEIHKRIENKHKLYFFSIIILLFIINIIFYKFFTYLIIFSSLILFFTIFLYFAKILEKIIFIKKISIDKLREGDWINEDIKINNEVLCSKNSSGITKKDIMNLKKNKIKYVIVKEGIPFIPGFFLGLVVSLTFKEFFIF